MTNLTAQQYREILACSGMLTDHLVDTRLETAALKAQRATEQAAFRDVEIDEEIPFDTIEWPEPYPFTNVAFVTGSNGQLQLLADI